MSTFQKTLLIAGCFIFCFAILGMLYQEAIMVMLFTFFIPGPTLGLIISFFKKSTIIQRILFFLTACIIYLLTLYIIDIKNIDYKLSPIRILLGSTIGAVLLQLFFDIIFKTKINYQNTLIRPSILGFIASILTTIAAFFFSVTPTTGWLTVPLWVGLFSVFPLWFYLFGHHLIRTGKVCS
ncbi:MAG: hypothetical protein JWP69_1471 [Flaviaesturariibacter sp.]|nr:hypothetical protein [Flaviaesturariibacter sp.]